MQIATYADDVNIMARTQQDLKNTYILLEQNAKKIGLQINTTKTKVLTQTRANNPTVQNITIGVQKIDAVKHFTYLVTVITSNCNEMEEIQSRICRANTPYQC
jgi:hypothetical protein